MWHGQAAGQLSKYKIFIKSCLGDCISLERDTNFWILQTTHGGQTKRSHRCAVCCCYGRAAALCLISFPWIIVSDEFSTNLSGGKFCILHINKYYFRHVPGNNCQLYFGNTSPHGSSPEFQTSEVPLYKLLWTCEYFIVLHKDHTILRSQVSVQQILIALITFACFLNCLKCAILWLIMSEHLLVQKFCSLS